MDNKTDNNLACGICLEEYDSQTRRPLSLYPCGHTFCTNCIQQLSNDICPFDSIRIEGKATNWELLKLASTEPKETNKLISDENKKKQPLPNEVSDYINQAYRCANNSRNEQDNNNNNVNDTVNTSHSNNFSESKICKSFKKLFLMCVNKYAIISYIFIGFYLSFVGVGSYNIIVRILKLNIYIF